MSHAIDFARMAPAGAIRKGVPRAGGEPAVTVRGGRIDGRCSELAVRFARRAGNELISIVHRIGETIIIPPAGNNLRDLYLLARGSQHQQFGWRSFDPGGPSLRSSAAGNQRRNLR